MLRLSFMVLFLTIGASGQETPIKAPQRAAPLSCTSKVESSACKWTQGAFSSAQTTSTAMRSVEVVIADSEAFQQELDRLKAKYSNLLKANPSAAEHSKLTLPSPFERSILFELGDGEVISKVVVRVELFNHVNFAGTQQSKEPPPVEFDKDSAMTWATFVMGYVEGCMWSRVHTLAEAAETPKPYIK
jgi:hypothetical protein